MPDRERRLQKVATFQIVKPVNMSWSEFGKMLRDVRYRLYRLANMALSEKYLEFQKKRMGQNYQRKHTLVTILNRTLRQILIKEGIEEKDLQRYSRDGAVSGYISGSFEHNKLSAISKKFGEVLRGNISLPVFKRELAIPINCSDARFSIIEKTESGNYEVDLRICQQDKQLLPNGYPRVLLSTERISKGQREILERLVDNKTFLLEGYRHRFFEIKQKGKDWFLSVTYDFPKSKAPRLHPDIIVGVDLGWSVPLYAAINNGFARIGWKKLEPLAMRIRHLQKQIKARRLSIQRGGDRDLAAPTARSGHGRKRILLPIEKLEGKIDNAYKTLNHQLSHCVIEFAKNHGAGTIQIENLSGLQEELTGTFLGMYWRREQLQRFIKYKSEEAGITVKEINPCMTSRRCSDCGFINKDFTFDYRQDYKKKNGKNAMFECPKCSKEKKDYKLLNADYNAARNLATADIEEKIRLQCKDQGIKYKELAKA